jgi:CDP-glucose 4,6-dehydratase
LSWDPSRSTVLVTGAQGFVGSWLAERLLDDGARVVVPQRDIEPEARFRTDGLEQRCVVVAADIEDYEAMTRVLAEHGVDTVFHLAAQAIAGTAQRSPLATYEANVRGSYVLLEACRAASVVGNPLERIVVASSYTAYGPQAEPPYREDLALQPSRPYDVTKACADLIARSYAATYRLPIAVTRLANVYGGGDLNWSRIVPETCRALVSGDAPVVRSDGTPERDYLYVEDAVDAYLAIARSLDDERMWGRAWNAGWGTPLAVRELVDRLIATSGKDVAVDVRGEADPGGEVDCQYLDSTAIHGELGWEPRVGLNDGLRRTYDWYAARLP